MFAPINPKNEEMRAQAILGSLTEREKAADLFASRKPQREENYAQVEVVKPVATTNRNNGQSFLRALKAIKLNP